jgi:hypothetical protein
MIGQDRQGTSGRGHPLPDSDDAHDALQPSGDPVAPDGESYEIRHDQAEHQDRGQSFAEGSGRG